MKKLDWHSSLLLLLTVAFLLTSTSFAQEIDSVSGSKKNLTQRLREIARAKHSTAPFTVLTPMDLASLKQFNNSFSGVQFGASGDVPAAADYGDGKADIAVFRPSESNWYLLNSTTGFSGVHFGSAGDVPVQSAFIR